FDDVLRSCNALSGEVYAKKIDSVIWRWVHALALTQLKSHYNGYINATYRYYLIFSEPQLKMHIEQCIGISYVDYLRCSLWLHAVFSRELKVPKSYFLGKKNDRTVFSEANMSKVLRLLSFQLKEIKDRQR